MLTPVGQVEGIGSKIRDRLIAADISSVQRLAAATVESLTKIEGVGPKSAEKLIDRAAEMVEQLETEYEDRHADDEVETATTSAKAKLSEADVFEDSEDFVTEADDTLSADAPDLEDVDDEDEVEKLAPVEVDESDEGEQEDKE